MSLIKNLMQPSYSHITHSISGILYYQSCPIEYTPTFKKNKNQSHM